MKISKLYILNTKIQCYYYNIAICLRIRRCIQNKKISNSILFTLIPFFILKWAICSFLDYILRKHIEKQKQNENRQSFKYPIAIVAICKNEGKYIREWIEYHRLKGINKFFIYDNESNDETKDILKPYIDKGIVSYIFFPGKSQQLKAYNDAINRAYKECKYLAFIDLDEFIYLDNKSLDLYKYIDDMIMSKKGACGIGINWCIFGSSGKIEKDDGLVIERFLYSSNASRGYNHHIKTICNPRMIKTYISPHFPLYKLGAHSINENGTRLYAWYNVINNYQHLRINHYFTKSKSEFIQKRARGLADRIGMYDLEKFNKYDLNDNYDNSMLYYANKIKKGIFDI